MNKRMRNMLVLSGVCVLCFAGYGISVAMQKDTSPESTSIFLILLFIFHLLLSSAINNHSAKD